MIPIKTVDRYLDAKDKLDYAIKSRLQTGTIVRWKRGQFQGRRARIKRLDWEVRAFLEINVLVETERADGKGWIDTHPPHRYYLEFERNFEFIEVR